LGLQLHSKSNLLADHQQQAESVVSLGKMEAEITNNILMLVAKSITLLSYITIKSLP
jgi:hypothetical protein